MRVLAVLTWIALVCSASCATVSVPPCPTELGTETCGVFQGVNQARIDEGLTPYRWSPELAEAAQLHAEDMVNKGYFDHASQDGRTFGQRAKAAGYTGFATGENIAAGQRTAQAAMDTWMNSTGHRNNILSSRSNEIGVGFIKNHWVQVFGAAN